MRPFVLFLVSFLLFFLLIPKLFIQIPAVKSNILITSLIHAVIFSILFFIISQFLQTNDLSLQPEDLKLDKSH